MELDLSKQQFFKPDSFFFVRRGITAEVDYVYRPGLRSRHIFSIGLTVTKMLLIQFLSLIQIIFPVAKQKIVFPFIRYTLQYFHADYNVYPTKGFFGQAILSHHGGFNSPINLTQLQIISSYTFLYYQKHKYNLKKAHY